MSDVSFRNSTSHTISVAYMRRDFACGDDCGDPWDVRGWIILDPGEKETRANDTDNRWYYYYAESDDGFWSGSFIAEVKASVFHKCTCIGVIQQNGHASNPYHRVGMRELDLKKSSGVNFV
jgi:Protein of unknown function (DUF1036)